MPATVRPAAAKRASTEKSAYSTSNSVSPSESPSFNPSPHSSSTSLSDLDVKTNSHPKLINTYGQEFKIPDYTIKDIYDAIPKHCFKRSALKSLSYVFRDMVYLTVTFIAFNNYIIPAIPNVYGRAVAWAVYTVLQGLFGTGLWVMAHECGHGAFSDSKTINNTVGWILHSSLLVPYFSWQISHHKHHKATGHMQRDMVFVPRTRAEYALKFGAQVSELMEETPLYTAGHMIAQQLFGWPLYLITNVTGHNFHERQSEGRGKGKKNGWFTGVNHFDPASPLYEFKHSKLILLSDLGLAIMGFILYAACQRWGAANVLVWYGIPYLWVNHWLVAITYLQHTDPTLPHYDQAAWNFTRGAAATIDREFGFIGRHLLHGIIETHVAHHYVSSIPFYNADEATEALKGVMGEHYRSNTEGGSWGFLAALWHSARWCHFVEEPVGAEGSGVLFFRNRNGLGVAPRKEEDLKKKEIIIGADE
ncbi:Oleate hydroxylase fah12 [Orbilia oligospora]|uniref:Oleate hydroxylase fah12 n=1 Tax=Orbilia oligospora TaxID=2813651 RepID=A0A7C8JVT5_ORBOL|nr:Oleate hydroxylase fah12 [Orbilia oligospora]KAF3088061.1 Oleate hydroxylase fah12 [Orbilia oligospora]KAF3112995.1 Oleate hydroxylase fah12 [Orbilia oligospora]KAF3127041.1 Oleate hydroxylase fah12 [Orbilia oligospora]KAF3129303.1 Oleate hydroxylase fah12 [Orbilia oligospora]